MNSNWLTYVGAVLTVFACTALVIAGYQALDGSAATLLADPLGWLRDADPGLLSETLATATGVMLAVLGIAITVVAIVVELAANRYNHRITGLFIREPINIVVMTFFVITTIVSFWAGATLTPPPPDAVLPHAGFVVSLVLVSISLFLILPYFAFVISFVSPLNMIAKIRASAERAIGRAADHYDPALVARVTDAVDELHDVIRSAMELSDRSIAMSGIDALAQLVDHHQALRGRLPDQWFSIGETVAADPDFISLESFALEGIERDATWFEVKVFRQYLLLMMLSAQQMRDIAYLIAINSRRITIAAVRGNPQLLQLGIRCFNSYLRSTINAGDLRTAYYLLNQYRLVAEAITDDADAPLVNQIAGYFQFYGQLAFGMGQAFVLEVAAYDVMRLLEASVDRGSPNVDALLDLLLGFDRRIKDEAQAASLLGVRRAQVQAATMLLERGDEARARRIAADLAGEDRRYLAQVREQLESETRPQYWELTDRGITFGYLEPARRAHLERLFSWIE